MAFFRTKESRGDRSIGDEARRQRRRQQQAQQQVLAAHNAGPEAELLAQVPAP